MMTSWNDGCQKCCLLDYSTLSYHNISYHILLRTVGTVQTEAILTAGKWDIRGIRLALFRVQTPEYVHKRASDVKSSRPSCPRGQNFVLGLGLEDLSSVSDSASSICPRPVLELFILASWKCVSHPARRDEQHCSVITGQRQHHRVRRQHHSLPHHRNSTDTWLSSTVKHSIRQPHFLTWTSLCLTFLFYDHSFLGCSVYRQVLPLSREFSLTVAMWHNHVGMQSTHVECCSGDTSLLEMQFSLVSTRCRASHCRSYDSSLYACSTLWLELFFVIDDDDDKWQ